MDILTNISPTNLTKLYYSIGEVADMFDVNTSLVRFWEKEFDLKTKKNKKGNRLFTPKDVMKLRHIYLLVKIQGHTLDGAKMALKSNEAPREDVKQLENHDIIRRLENIKSKLMTLK